MLKIFENFVSLLYVRVRVFTAVCVCMSLVINENVLFSNTYMKRAFFHAWKPCRK